MVGSYKFFTGRLAGLLLAISLAVLAGCDDSTETKNQPAPNPPGEGSLESPYIIQYNDAYKGIPLAAGGVAWILAENVPAGWSVAQTDSTEDIGLAIFGFNSFLGHDTAVGSYTDATGAESAMALGDGVKTDLFLMVDGTAVRTDGATFDVTIVAGSAPADTTLTLQPCTFTPPNSSCGMPGTSGTTDVDLPFVMAPEAPLSVSVSNPTGEWVFYTAGYFNSGSMVDFDSNEATGLGGGFYGNGYCHVNAPAGTVDTGTCVLNPNNSGYPPQFIIVANNTGTADVIATLSFSSP